MRYAIPGRLWRVPFYRWISKVFFTLLLVLGAAFVMALVIAAAFSQLGY